MAQIEVGLFVPSLPFASVYLCHLSHFLTQKSTEELVSEAAELKNAIHSKMLPRNSN